MWGKKAERVARGKREAAVKKKREDDEFDAKVQESLARQKKTKKVSQHA